MKRNLKSKRIQDAVNRFLNKDLKNRQSFMRVVDSEGRIKENVVFRVEDDGNILSVFPNTYGNADRSRDTMVCADSKGHSVCTYDYVEEYTRAADAAEYEALYNQLTDSVGYSLTVLDKLPTRTELAKVRDNFIKAYRDERKKRLADAQQQIEDARMLERGEEIEYKGKRGKVQYALFHGQEPVIIRWQNEDGSEEFEVPYDEVGDLKVHDSVNEKPQADNKVKDDDESADESVDENVDENTDIEEGDEVADGCGKKKKTQDSKVNIFKRKTTKKQ